jgi:hypothetical protein
MKKVPGERVPFRAQSRYKLGPGNLDRKKTPRPRLTIVAAGLHYPLNEHHLMWWIAYSLLRREVIFSEVGIKHEYPEL